jgi:hypothetical protein
MRVVRMAWLVAGLATAVVAGCSSTQSGTAQVDAGNPAGCPSASPSSGEACSAAGLLCTYGCNVRASCDGHTWTVADLGIPCPVDAGAPDGPVACGTSNDCSSGFSCSPGGTPVGCGICVAPQNACNTDSDCRIIDDAAATTPYVCGPPSECECGFGGKTGECIPACTGPGDCSADEACSSGHCVPKPCSSDADCPSPSTVDYACSAGVCGVKSCSSDADCGAHYCVNRTCYPLPGACTPPAA